MSGQSEVVADALVFLEQSGVEHRRVVAAEDNRHAGSEQPGERMRGKRRYNSGSDVAGRADLQGDPLLTQAVEQGRVAGCGDAVADSFGSELVYGCPDLVRAYALPGVRQAVEPGCASDRELVSETRAPYSCFRAAQAEPDQSGWRVMQGSVECLLGAFASVASGYVIDPGQFHALGTGGGSTGIECLRQLTGLNPRPQV